MRERSRAEGPRFRLVRHLGVGGEGRVDLVRDALREQDVALKRVRSQDPHALLRLKNEFRAVEQLAHPGLVRLYELGEDDEGSYFTMEAIDGVTLDRWCAESSPSAPKSLETTLAQLRQILPPMAEALAFLHAHGLVHRDLKPSNVMVRADGVVQLLDFGILAELGASGDFVGTPAYMAPEQMRNEAVTAAADLYAFGVMLFEIVAGRLPFVGNLNEIIVERLTGSPAPLDTYMSDAPPALVRACARLLEREPRDRPTLAELEAELFPAIGARRARFAIARGREPELVGRADLQATLAALLEHIREGDGAFEARVLRGSTGVGKTALARWLAKEAQAREFFVLRGRARSSERVPFNLLDGAIDALAQIYEDEPSRVDDDVARLLGIASTAFPVLLHDEALLPRAAPQRPEVFAAIASLLENLASRAAVLVILDELHAADDDSLALLDELLERAPPGLLLLATARDDVPSSRASQFLEARSRLGVLDVPPLDEQAIAAVIADAIAKTVNEGGRRGEISVDAEVVRRCAGRPLLAEVIGRALASEDTPAREATPTTALSMLVALRSAEERALVRALWVADEATSVTRLARVLGHAVGEVDDRVRTLAREGLVRITTTEPSAHVELYHEAVRASVAALADAGEASAMHAAFLALDTDDATAPDERVVRHLLGAGRAREAGARALLAAPRAEKKLAFGLAADLYAIALDQREGEPRAVLRALATALDRGARSAEAATRWAELVALETDDERIDAAMHEASSLLANGDIAAGHLRLAATLREAGEPTISSTGLGAVFAGLSFLRGPSSSRTVRRPPPLDPVARGRAERDLRLGMLTTYFNPLGGIRFLVRARRGFERASAYEQAAWCDYLFAYVALYGDDQRRPVPLAERYLASARARIGDRHVESAEVSAFPYFIDAYAAMRTGGFAEARPLLETAIERIEGSGLSGSFAHLYGLCNRFELDYAEQEFARAARSLQRLVAASKGSTETTPMHVQIAIYRSLLAHLRGDFDDAFEVIDALRRQWPREPPTIQRALLELVAPWPNVLRTDGREVRRAFARAVAADKSFRLLRCTYAGLYAAPIALAEARALKSGDPDASIRVVERYRRICAEAPPLATTRAIRALAYAEEARNQVDRVLPLLEEAEREATKLGQTLDVAVSRYQRGKRLGGDGGRELMTEARAVVARMGVAPIWLEEDEV